MGKGPTKLIKILYIVQTLDIGGTEGQVKETVLRLDRERFDSRVACLLDPDYLGGEGSFQEDLVKADVQVDSFNFKTLFRNLPRNFFPVISLVRYIRKWKPDIVHALYYWPVIFGTLAGRLAGVPVIMSGRRYINWGGENRFYLRWLEGLANRGTHCVVANSRAVMENVLMREKLPAEKVRLIYNGCDYQKFTDCRSMRLEKRRELGIGEGEFVIGILANLTRNKGQEYLLKALPQLIEVREDLKVMLVGLNQGHEARLRAVCRDLKVEDKVVFTGQRSDIPALLGAMDVGVCTSLYSEGFSNAILEMMAAGLPLIATDVGGNPEAVVNGDTGFIISPQDSEAIARSILKLIENPGLAAKIGRAGRERVKQFFSMEKMIENTEELYTELLEKNSNAHIG